MNKDSKLRMFKTLIIVVFLILGNTALAQHPLLGPDELDVYAFSGQLQVTIGKQANDEGRTCYKWNGPFTSADENEERIGSKQVFDLPSNMMPNMGYPFELTVIGEQYYQQTVTVHIVDEITFQVRPIRGCISGNEIPVIEDFEITTTPSGYENLVSIDYSRCHQYSDGRYLVFFKLVVSGAILDSHSVYVLNTDMVSDTTTHWIDPWGDDFRGVFQVVSVLTKSFNAFGCWPHLDVPTVFGSYKTIYRYDCCETKMRYRTIDIDEMGIKYGFHIDCAIPFLVVLRVGLRAGFQIEQGLHNCSFDLGRTCRLSPIDELDVGYGSASLSGGAFIDDITGGLVCSASVDLVGKFYFYDMKIILTGNNASTKCKFDAELYLEGKVAFLTHYQVKAMVPICSKRTFNLQSNIF